MGLSKTIQTGIFYELIKRSMVGQRVWGSSEKRNLEKLGKISSGKGLAGKVPLARKVSNKSIANMMAAKSDTIKKGFMSSSGEREKRLAKALSIGSKIMSRRK